MPKLGAAPLPALPSSPQPSPSPALLILASGSIYRRDLLSRLRLPFICQAADLDETPLPAELPQATCIRLAHSKALAVAQHHADALVIGCDQVADFQGQALSKPGSLENAREQLTSLRGQTITFYSAVCVVHNTTVLDAFCVPTEVKYRQYNPLEIERYLALEPAFDCAGAAKCEGLGTVLVESIQSEDPTALIGLPLIKLAQTLRTQGFALP